MNDYKQNKRLLQSTKYLLLPILFLFTLTLTQPVFASVQRSLVTVPGTPVPKDAAGAPTDQAYAKASVSVVRLLISYTDTSGNPVANCTGLGVLVKSFHLSNAPNDWVLTDSALVNQGICASGSAPGRLAQLQIFFNTTYNNKTPVTDHNSAPLENPTIVCTNADLAACNSGPALLPFQGEVAPFLHLAPSPTNDHAAIALTDTSRNLPAAADTPANDTQFLTPQTLDPNALSQLEPGTPLINASGQLTGLHSASSSSPIPLADIFALMQKIPVPSSDPENTVNTNWKNGITDYYKKNYPAASTEFHQAATSNSNFQGASDFENFAKTANTFSPAPTPVPGGTLVIPGLNLPIVLWQFSILVLLFLILAVLLLWLFLRSRVQRRRADNAELDDAERRAAVEVQRIEAMETAQRNWMDYNRASEQSTLPIQPQALQDKTLVRQPPKEFHCPSCGEVVMPDANYCPNCSQLLSPTESGLHRRVRLPASPAQSQSPSLANSQSRPVPPPSPSMAPVSSIADQPTLAPFTPSVSPPDPMVEHSPIQREPTVTMKFPPDLPSEITMPQRRLGFMVGTRSDPGIKRKYKPNEDSLLAAQGLVSMPVPQPFGLFVVADGMGGHANGQDASRLAIQMIVENVLPRLVTDTTGSLDFAKVLVDGIQSANQAVHQQNMDKRGDMGTTITSTLVVGNLAYVVNVGDSRTYLYRDNKGLQKVTNDHSVVASLVEAGIIKPDDIYTHPKRNQIYRSLGEKANVEVDEFTIQLRPGDKLLLCSDGLWDMVRDPRIEEVIKRPVPDPSMTGDALIQSALEGGGEDNVSVIVVQITEGQNIDALPRLKVLAMPDSVQVPKF